MENLPESVVAPEIHTDLPCYVCGYNLKGMGTDVNCPECGVPIARTLRSGLQHADPVWLGRQAAAIPFLSALSVVGLLEVFSFFSEPIPRYIGSLAHIAAAVFVLVGCFRLSAPEPDPVTGDVENPIRRGLIVAAILFVILKVAALDIFFEMRLSRFYPTAAWMIGAQRVALAVAELLALMLLSHLARRSDSPSLRAQSRFMQYAVPLVTVAPLITGFIPYDSLNVGFATTVYVVFRVVFTVIMCVLPLFLGRLYEVVRAAANAPRGRFVGIEQ
jgi:hypothetical protein